MKKSFVSGSSSRCRALIIQPVVKNFTGENKLRSPEAAASETLTLAKAIDLEVVTAELVTVNHIHPATYLGQGAVAAIKTLIANNRINLVIFNCLLSPVQQRCLELVWAAKVIDRTALILEIFGARARTREGILQVELAHLSYQRSRLIRSWTHLERQRGGFGFLGGPGEAQIEVDRRLIARRIARLQREIEAVKRTRTLHRQSRRKKAYPIVALVGYTNAGKSTLFNALTQANVVVANQLFATLDPTMRALELPSGKTVILSDTVGFISDLPHELVVSFRATLEEITLADVVIHIRDSTHQDWEAQRKDVESVLHTLGLYSESDLPNKTLIQVCNKIDLLDLEMRDRLVDSVSKTKIQQPIQLLSARTGEGLKSLLTLLDHSVTKHSTVRNIIIPTADGATLSWLYRYGEVLERCEKENYTHVWVRLSISDFNRLQTLVGKNQKIE